MGAWRLRLIIHPLTVASLVLLVVNDHLLKQRWPGLVTGKLSDVAGVFLVGALAVALTGSVRWGTSLTALAFAALKTVTVVAVWAAPLLGGQTLRDRTDLVALLVLWPLGRLATHVGATASRHVHDGWGTIGAVFVVLGAVFATSATSCLSDPSVSEVALDAQGRVLFHYSDHRGNAGWYSISGDAPVPVTGAEPVGEVRRQQCTDEGCYRLTADAVTLDGATVFSYSADRRADPPAKSGCNEGPYRSLVAVGSSEGTDVWVAMGVAGALHRTPDGTWHELAVFEAKPPPTAAQRRSSHAITWVLPLLMAVLVGVIVPTGFFTRVRRRNVWWALGLGLTVNLAWAPFAWWVLADNPIEPGPVGLLAWSMVAVLPLAILQLAWIVPLVVGRSALPVAPLRAPAAWWPQGLPVAAPAPPQDAVPPEDRTTSFN